MYIIVHIHFQSYEVKQDSGILINNKEIGIVMLKRYCLNLI